MFYPGFRVGTAEVEITFVVDDEGRHAAGDGVLGEFFKAGIPKATDGVPGFEVCTDEIAPLASDGIGGLIFVFVPGIRRAQSGGPVDHGKATALVHEFLEGIKMAIGGVRAPTIGVNDEGVVCKKLRV